MILAAHPYANYLNSLAFRERSKMMNLYSEGGPVEGLPTEPAHEGYAWYTYVQGQVVATSDPATDPVSAMEPDGTWWLIADAKFAERDA